jgi:hypothetical protein
MISSLDVMNQLSMYLHGGQNAQGLQHWIVAAQLEGKDEVEPLADRLISEMDGFFAQFSDGLMPESLFRKECAKLLLSESTLTQSVQIQYSFVRPSFVNPLPKTQTVSSSETASTVPPNGFPQTQQLVAA